jgi:hypothetical protein
MLTQLEMSSFLSIGLVSLIGIQETTKRIEGYWEGEAYHLAICEPVEGQIQKYSAGFKTATDFVHPGIIEGHPPGTLTGRNVGRFDAVPEVGRRQVLVRAVWVDAPFAFACVAPKLEELGEHGPGRREEDIMLFTDGQHYRGEYKQNGR